MAITNTQANIVVDETVRPLAEELRALKIKLEAALTELSGDAATFFDVAGSGAGSTYTDLRTDAVPRLLTASDIVDIRSRIITILADLQTAGFMDSINRACVRAVQNGI